MNPCPDGTRRHLTIWGSYDNATNWVKLKDLDFGPSGYSDMTLVGPDTILLAYNHGHTVGALFGDSGASELGITSYYKIGLLRICFKNASRSYKKSNNASYNQTDKGDNIFSLHKILS